MRAAGRTGSEDCPVQMKLVAPPLYVLTTQTLDKAKGIQVLNEAIEVAEQSIKSHKGSFKVKEAPRTVSERDDFLLQTKVNTQDWETFLLYASHAWHGLHVIDTPNPAVQSLLGSGP